MDLLVFPKTEGDPFENIPEASLPVSGIGFFFTNLIFIPTSQGGSFLAAGDGADGIFISGSDIFLFGSEKNPSKGLLQSLTSIGLRCP